MSPSPTCPVDGYPYSAHPPGTPPTPRYLRKRTALLEALASVIYLPNVSPAHRRAIYRARAERRAAS